MAEKKYVYDVRVNGKCIVNGEGKKSRGTIIKKIIETGEMPGGNHAKSFVTFLAVRLFPAESIEFNMHELHESMDSNCLLYTSPSPRDRQKSRMPSSA